MRLYAKVIRPAQTGGNVTLDQDLLHLMLDRPDVCDSLRRLLDRAFELTHEYDNIVPWELPDKSLSVRKAMEARRRLTLAAELPMELLCRRLLSLVPEEARKFVFEMHWTVYRSPRETASELNRFLTKLVESGEKGDDLVIAPYNMSMYDFESIEDAKRRLRLLEEAWNGAVRFTFKRTPSGWFKILFHAGEMLKTNDGSGHDARSGSERRLCLQKYPLHHLVDYLFVQTATPPEVRKLFSYLKWTKYLEESGHLYFRLFVRKLLENDGQKPVEYAFPGIDFEELGFESVDDAKDKLKLLEKTWNNWIRTEIKDIEGTLYIRFFATEVE